MKYICPECDAQFDDDPGKCPTDGCRLLPFKQSVDALVGKEIAGRFLVKKKLGEGGMGAVYIAHQASVDRLVALKVLKPEFQEDITVVKRFFLEAKAASRLRNSHTITIYDFDKTQDGILYIAMELLSGRDLRAKMDDIGRLSLDETVRILDGVSESLAEAHEAGIVHRDMKPENIFLSEASGEHEFVKVLDFGIAKAQTLTDTKMTRTGIVQGTPAYMAPEAIIGEKIGPEADVYALGIMMYEMIAGLVPFKAETPMQMMMAHLQKEPQPIEEICPDIMLPRSVHDFLWRCLAKQREQRPADAGQFREDLKAAMAAATGSDSERMKPLYVTGAGFRGASDTVSSLSPGERASSPGRGSDTVVRTAAAGADDLASLIDGAPSKKGTFIALGVGLALIAAVVGFFVLRPGAQPPAPAPAPAPAVVAAAVPAVKPAAPEPKKEEPKPIETVALTITSTPQGADVELGGRLVGKTPLMHKVPKSNQQVHVVVSLAGYLRQESELVPSDDQLFSKILEPDPALQKKEPPPPEPPVAVAKPRPAPRPAAKPVSKTPSKPKKAVDDLLLD